MSVSIAEKPPRKFPPPCWSQDEALALIDAYRERWYALRRGYLRTADWENVAAAVANRCPDASPAKTSAQCRHKMEKLRQRYRAEKQRSLSYPGRFFSSWFFFENMDSMVGSNQDTDDHNNSGNGSGLKPSIDNNLMTSGIHVKNNKKIDGDSSAVLGLESHSIDQNSVPFGFGSKNYSKIDERAGPNFGSRAPNGSSLYYDAEDGIDFEGGFRVKNPIDGNSVHQGLKAKKFGKVYGNMRPNFDFDHDGGKGFDAGGGFHMRSAIDQDFVPPGYRAKKFVKMGRKLNPSLNCDDGEYDNDDDDEVWLKIRSDRNSVPPEFRAKNSGKIDRDSKLRFDSRFSNGYGKSGGGGGVKRGRDPMEEMVASIRFLGEGFVKMEKMKMDMATEIEKMRMEMEMKRNKLILESQQQIVDAFVKVLVENKKVVKTTVVLPES